MTDFNALADELTDELTEELTTGREVWLKPYIEALREAAGLQAKLADATTGFLTLEITVEDLKAKLDAAEAARAEAVKWIAQRCAEICEEAPPEFSSYSVGYNEACSDCANLIRAAFPEEVR